MVGAETPPWRSVLIKLVNVTKTFQHDSTDRIVAVDRVSLDVAEGAFLVLVGSNGSGKTTLLNLISGAVFPDDGQIFLDGEQVENQAEYVRARKIARIFQEAEVGILPSMSVEENLAIAQTKGAFPSLFKFVLSRNRRKEADRVLASFGMSVEHRLRARATSLSGGQRQALAISMAVLSEAKVLLLDEHTASLDPQAAPVIMQKTHEIICRAKMTAIMVTHDLSLAIEYGTHLALMHRGRIVRTYDTDEKKTLNAQTLLAHFTQATHGFWDSGVTFSTERDISPVKNVAT
jgi:putative ABC transport system ATP-binding protein